LILAFVLATGAACSKKAAPDHDRAIDVAAAAPDGAHPSCPVLTKDGACDPLLQKDVVKLASGGLVLPGAWFPLSHDAALVVGVRWTAQRLITVKSAAPSSYDGASDMAVEQASGATGVTAGGDRLLYFLGRSGDAPALQIAKVGDDAGIGESSVLRLEGTVGTPRWPQAVGLADGRTLLALVGSDDRILAGASDGSSTFHLDAVPFGETERLGILAHVGITTAGAWIVSYQASDTMFHFHAGVVVSHDEGQTWSPPLPIPLDPGETLSDLFPIARLDHGADLYYARGELGNEQIRRRALHDDGTLALGPEQLVTSDDIGRVEKPQPRRRPDGRLAMLLTIRRGVTGTLALGVLDGDAPW
jgi:hypothetical protein